MITVEDIKKLAKLSRIEISEEEATSLTRDIEPILKYVGQVKDVVGEYSDEVELGEVFNVMREDTDPTQSGLHTEALMAEAPDTEGGYLKVKKIL